MSSALKILPHYTFEDFSQWEGRWELIEGIPYAMSPSPSPRHQWISSNLKSEFRVEIKKHGCGKCKVYDFLDLKYSEDTIFQPDGIIACSEITKPYIDFPPQLVFEVLSPASALKDVHSKFSFYEKFGIHYYLIVDAEKQLVQIFRLTDGVYSEIIFDQTIPFQFDFDDDCKISMMLTNIWD